MGSKAAATYHGIDCGGGCCPPPSGTGPRNGLDVCFHGRACRHHLRQDAQLAQRDRAEELDDDLRDALARDARRRRARQRDA